MNIKVFVMALLLIIPSLSHSSSFRNFSDWTEEEKRAYLINQALHYIDYKQTVWAMRQVDENGNPLFVEANPAWGPRITKSTAMKVKVASAGLMYWVIGRYGFENPIAKRYVYGSMIVQTAVVVNNHSVGANIKVAF
jgi:hypothetical protein